MTRKDFSNIVNRIVKEEEASILQEMHDTLDPNNIKSAIMAVAKISTQSAEIAASVTSRILTESGLIHFDE